MRTIGIVSVIAAAIVACGCGGNADAGAAGSGGGGAGGAGSGGAGGDVEGGVTVDGQTVTLTMDSFDVGPGEEVFKCQNFANPFGGAQVDVAEFESHMTKGSHHLLLFYRSDVKADGPLSSCSGLEFAATPYGAQQPDYSVSYPPGIASAVDPTHGLRLQAHYINVGQETIHAVVTLTMHLADPASVTEHAGQLFLLQPDIDVPPGQTMDVSQTCAIPYDIQLLGATAHMHRHGTKFVASANGQPIYSTTSWDSPTSERYDPPIAIAGGQNVTFTCTFKNDTASDLTFGESALSNEMCIFLGQFYPVSAGHTIIGCK